MNRNLKLKNVVQVWLFALLFLPGQLWSQANCSQAPCAQLPDGNGPDPCTSKLYCTNNGNVLSGFITCTPSADTDGCGIDASDAAVPISNSDTEELLFNLNDPDCFSAGWNVQWIRFMTPAGINQFDIQGVGGRLSAYAIFHQPDWDFDTDAQADAADLCNDPINDFTLIGTCTTVNQWTPFVNLAANPEENLYFIAMIYENTGNGSINFKVKECASNPSDPGDCVPLISCPEPALFDCNDLAGINDWLASAGGFNCGDDFSVRNNFADLTFTGCDPVDDYVVEFTLVDGNGDDVLDINDNPIQCTSSFVTIDIGGQSLTCIAPGIQVTLSQGGCDAEITAGDVVPNWMSYPGFETAFTIMLFYDEDMTMPVPSSPFVTGADVGQTIYIKVIYNPTGNNEITCWTTTDLVEDKDIPELDCSPDDIIVSCLDDLSPSTEIDAVAGFPVDLNTVTIIPNLDGSFTLQDFDPCGDATLTFVDVETPGSCMNGIVKTIDRTWTATDINNNTSSCTETFVVESSDLPVEFPELLHLECSNTNPPSTDPADTGYPQIGGIDITDIPNACNLFSVPVDVESPISNSCLRIITRTWFVYCDWIEIDRQDQIIKIMDTTAPVFDNCPTEPIEVNASSEDCTASVILPLVTATDDCNNATLTPAVSNGILSNNDLAAFGLPLGDTEVTVTAVDDCDNESECVYIITAVDLTPPVVSCETFHTVGIVGDPTQVAASVFDDGSEDYCGAVSFLVRRMEGAQCQFDDFTDFSETAPFFCCDIGEDIMVELQVKDEAGNTNSCMVSVEVQDKLDPAITCPPDKNLECDQDIDDLSLAGTAVAIDNCGPVSVDYTDTGSLDMCSEGVITRTWVATDGAGNTAECTYTLTVENSDPFDGNTDIDWPDDILDPPLDCTESTDPSNTGVPVLTKNSCDLAEVALWDPNDDLIIPATNPQQQGFLYKIQRTWTVVDWCNLDDQGNPSIFTDAQFIKVVDNDAPTFTCPSDVTISGGLNLDLVLTDIADNCTDLADIQVSYSIDQEFDGTFSSDVDGSGADASGSTGAGTDYPVGDNRVIFTVTDNAGNSSTCVVDVNVSSALNCDILETEADDLHVVEVGFTGSGTLDANDPGLYQNIIPNNPTISLDGSLGSFGPSLQFTCADLVDDSTTLVIVFIEFDDGVGGRLTCPATVKVADLTNPAVSCKPNPTVEISSGAPYSFTSNDIVNNVADICTNTNDLTYVFTPATVDCAFLLNNGNGSDLSVTVVVTDKNGNSGGCSSDVTISTNDVLCAPANISSNVAGIIENEEGVEVEYVHIEASGGGMFEEVMTTETGDYSFSLINEDNYVITPDRNDDPLNGVSTLDLIRINQHILQVESLGSPYKIIAADINRSGEVTTFDLVSLRKLILHIDSEFTNNTSWRFVDAGFVFPDPANPFITDFPEVYTINGLTEDMQADFVAIKVGDVNCSASANDLVGGGDNRNAATPVLFQVEDQYLKVGESYKVDFNLQDITELQGYQFTLHFDPNLVAFEELEVGELRGMSMSNFGLHLLDLGVLTASWHTNEMIDIDQTTAFSIQITARKDMALSEVLSFSSAYTKSEAYIANDIASVDLAFATELGLVTKHFQLYQNRPNPFKGETVISFQLPESEEGVLTIYDLTGRIVKTIRRSFIAGYNEVALSSTDLAGDGVYFYQLDVADYSAMRKMILLQ
jgi:hypothetical protein